MNLIEVTYCFKTGTIDRNQLIYRQMNKQIDTENEIKQNSIRFQLFLTSWQKNYFGVSWQIRIDILQNTCESYFCWNRHCCHNRKETKFETLVGFSFECFSSNFSNLNCQFRNSEQWKKEKFALNSQFIFCAIQIVWRILFNIFSRKNASAAIGLFTAGVKNGAKINTQRCSVLRLKQEEIAMTFSKCRRKK